VIGSADAKGDAVFLHFDKPRPEAIRNGAKNIDLNKLMQNVGAEQFDYGTFKAAYDTDPRVKSMVKNFNKYGIEPMTKNELDASTDTPATDSSNAVNKMAKRATDLTDL
jgi:hypothetical protein